MKKNYFFVAVMLSAVISDVSAQVNYAFSATTAVYTPITGGTTPALFSRPWDLNKSSPTYDEGIANNIPLGFIFNYNGVDYTSINICANGFATLGSPFRDTLSYVENFYINNLTAGPIAVAYYGILEPNVKPVLAPLWDDLRFSSNASLRYTTTGAAGSRLFTFEWSMAKWQFDAASPALSFELKLYEGTNVVEFCYKDEGGVPKNASASIGITASDQTGGGRFLSLQNTSSAPAISNITEDSNLSVKPANNQVYRFIPLPCKLPLNLHYTSYTNTSVNFVWDVPAGVSGFEYAVDTSYADPLSGTLTSSTNISVASLSYGQKYFIHVRSFCSASSKSAWVSTSFTTTKDLSAPPDIAWQKFIGTGRESVNSFERAPGGGYLIAGTVGTNNYDCWIAQLDENANLLWQKTLGGSGYEEAYSIKKTADSGFIVAGFSYSNDGDVSGHHGSLDSADCWVVKLTSSGAMQWQKSLGGTGDDAAFSMDATSDGGYILAGVTYSGNGDVTGYHANASEYVGDIWVVKLDSNGNMEWQRALGGTLDEAAFNIRQTSDGGFIIATYTSSNDGDVNGNHGGDDGWIVKLSSSGSIQWQKSLGGSSVDHTNSIDLTTDGGYVIAGYTGSRDGDVSGNLDTVYAQYWIVKLDAAGALQWQKSYGGSMDDAAQSIQQTSDGGYIVAGSSASNDGDVNGHHGGYNPAHLPYDDAWIVKLDSLGNFQWQKCLGGSSHDAASYIQETEDHGYIVRCYSESNDGDVIANHGEANIWIVKLGRDALLPITLVNFSGKVQGKQNRLYWTTATEQNNTGFEVQRSSDGYNFRGISFVKSKAANGNSTFEHSYDFTDIAFSASANYYRLKQIDKDGKFSYSNIVVLRDENPVTDGTITLYPNPVKSTLNVKIGAVRNTNFQLLVTDVSGRTIMNKPVLAGTGETLAQLDVSHFSAGAYFIKLIPAHAGRLLLKKFMKE